MKKKLFALILVCFSLLILIGCGKNPVNDYWNNFISAVNNKDMEYVSGCFGLPAKDIEKFKADNGEYYKSLPTIETKNIELVTTCNFSSEQYINNLYQLKVSASVGGEAKELNVYMREDNNGLFFCSTFNFTNDDEDLGNQPDSIFKKSVYYQNKNYIYSFDEEKTYAIFVNQKKNDSSIEIPSEIDGVPVKEIGAYAFYHCMHFFSVSFSTSRLKTINIPDSVITIDDYAFYQCKKVKELHIPGTVQSIGTRAFSGLSSLKTLYFDLETEEVEDAYTPVQTKAGSAFTISGGRNMLVGDIVTLTADRESVTWSVPSSTSTMVVVDPDTGSIRAIGPGKVTVTAMDNQTKEKATIDFLIQDCPSVLQANFDAFDRLSSLTAIYITATNPNAIKVLNGASFSFNSTCKIYVPEESADMYRAHAAWSKYASQIVGY